MLGRIFCERGSRLLIPNNSIVQLLKVRGTGALGGAINYAGNPCRCITTTAATLSSSDKLVKPDEDFWDKNKRLDRPMSPHLTIYAWQLTNTLSIMHRGTGVALSGLTSMFAIGMICASSPYPVLLKSLAGSGVVGPALIFSAKFLLAWPFFFHALNGIRHLAWDMGKGFELKDLYKSGYAVVGGATALALVAAAL